MTFPGLDFIFSFSIVFHDRGNPVLHSIPPPLESAPVYDEYNHTEFADILNKTMPPQEILHALCAISSILATVSQGRFTGRYITKKSL